MGCSCFDNVEELKDQNNKSKNENIIINKYDVKDDNKNHEDKCLENEKKNDNTNFININNKEDDVNFYNKNTIRNSINNENDIKKNIIDKNEIIEENNYNKTVVDKDINDAIDHIQKVLTNEMNSMAEIINKKLNDLNISDEIINGKNDNDESFGDKNDNDENIRDEISSESKLTDSELKEIENLINKNGKMFFLVFGEDFKEKYIAFLKSFKNFLDISENIDTTFYTLSFEQVKNIIENTIQAKILIIPYMNPKFFSLMVNNTKIISKYRFMEHIFLKNKDLSKIMIEIQIEIIKFIAMQIGFFLKEIDKEYVTYSFINFFQDIGFCIKYFTYYFCEMLYGDEFMGYEYHHDIRILYFNEIMKGIPTQSKFPQDLINLATESMRIKDTIILGEKQFKNHIISLNIQSQRIHELDENMLDSFFKKPYMENNKYKISKYFVICEEKNEKIYLEKFKSLSANYGFAYLFLVYIKSKQILDMRINLKEINSVIYIFNDFELLEYFKDNNERLKPNLQKFLPDNNNPTMKVLNELEEDVVYKDIKNFKSHSEDGWELFEFGKYNRFLVQINIISFHDFVDRVFAGIIKSYKEHNSLEILLKYYINYFCINLQPELIVNMTAYAKMFLYAYTLEEKDPHKNLYSILNDDLRSSNPSEINRHFDIIKLIGGLIDVKELKSYTGKVYRATYLNDELIKNIKVGLTITNSAFWSSTKKESVALKF